jgi:acetolactate synthase-1/2/3 large subunit
MGRALSACWSGRPGVVHLTVPEDIVNGAFRSSVAPGPAGSEERTSAVDASVRRRPTTVPTAPADVVCDAADLLVAAEAPLIHAGSGVVWAGAHDELRAVAELAGAAVTTSWAARDVIDERSAVAVPMPLVELVQRARVEADVVLVVGSRLGETDFWGKAPYWGRPGEQRVIQVDVDPSVIGVQRPVELGVVADARSFLGALAQELAGRDLGAVVDRHAERLASLGDERRRALADLAAAGADHTGSPLHSAHLMPICQEVAGDDAVWVLDGGNTAVWGASHLEVRRPRSVLGTWKYGMLGAGLGQALGAKVACPDRPVVALVGDGAMGFHPQEIETAVRHDLPVLFVVAVDRQWGMVKVNQEFATDPDTLLTEGALPAGTLTNTDLGEIRWDLVAEAMGAHGERADSPDTLRDAVSRALASSRCTVIHVDVDPVAHKFAPNLATFKAMHDEPTG